MCAGSDPSGDFSDFVGVTHSSSGGFAGESPDFAASSSPFQKPRLGHPLLTASRAGAPFPEELAPLPTEELKRSLLLPTKPAADQPAEAKEKKN